MKHLIVLFLLLFASSAHAASDNVIPYTLTPTGMMVVQLKIGGEEGRFLIDTGSNATIVTPRIASHADLNKSFALVDNTLGTKTKAPQVRLKITLPHLTLNLPMTVMPVDGFDGIIGMDVLGKFKELRIDFKSHTITLMGVQ